MFSFIIKPSIDLSFYLSMKFTNVLVNFISRKLGHGLTQDTKEKLYDLIYDDVKSALNPFTMGMVWGSIMCITVTIFAICFGMYKSYQNLGSEFNILYIFSLPSRIYQHILILELMLFIVCGVYYWILTIINLILMIRNYRKLQIKYVFAKVLTKNLNKLKKLKMINLSKFLDYLDDHEINLITDDELATIREKYLNNPIVSIHELYCLYELKKDGYDILNQQEFSYKKEQFINCSSKEDLDDRNGNLRRLLKRKIITKDEYELKAKQFKRNNFLFIWGLIRTFLYILTFIGLVGNTP